MEKYKLDKKGALRIVLILLGTLAVIGILVYVASTYVIPLTNSTSTEGADSSLIYSGGDVSKDITPPVAVDAVARESTTTTSLSDTKVIKTSTIEMTVNDFDASVTSIREIIKTEKGYVQNLSDSGTLNDRAVTITIKVPTDKFDSVLAQVKALGVEVTSAYENTDDVTQAYQDLQARLKNQKALEAQLLTILNKATKISDILLVQKQLSTVREQIELLQTEIKYYDTQTDYASVSVTMTKASEALNVAGKDWKPFGVVKEAFTVLVEVGKGIGTLAIWAVVFSPIVLVPYVIYLVVKKVKKSKK
jgi:hypothetical protein